MTPRRTALACALLTLCAAGLWQDASAATGFFAGTTVPIGEFSYGRKMGFCVGGEYTYDLTPMVGVGGLGAYHWLTPPAHKVGNSSVVEALAIAKIHPPVGVFLQGGIGLTYSSLDLTGQEGSSTDFTVAGGVGFSVMRIEISGLYTSVATGDGSRSFVTASVGTSF